MAIILIPWRNDTHERALNLEWVLGQYRYKFAADEIKLASIPASAPWNKARAVNGGLRTLKPDAIVVVADADVWSYDLHEAIEAVANGATWAVPHFTVRRLTAPATTAVLQGGDPRTQEHARPYEARVGGGIVIARASTLHECPMDARFVTWGQEDESWGYALMTLFGSAWQGKGPLYHLWHPENLDRIDRRKGSTEGWKLMKRYLRAKVDHDADATRELLANAR